MVVEQKVKISEFPEFSILYYYQNFYENSEILESFFLLQILTVVLTFSKIVFSRKSEALFFCDY